VTRYTEGFSHFVTSMTAPVASGWSDRRAGLAATGKAPPYHGAHPKQTFMVLDAKPMPSNQLPSTTGSFSAACWCCR